MLLRSLTKHVKAQNWFAVGLDFLIVVVGVFIGIQVANGNDARAFRERESELLVELRRELEASIAATEQKRGAYIQVAAAGNRSADFISSGATCGSECWPVLVDFFHASQWQRLDVNRSTYDEMRRLGLPRSRDIVDAVEFHFAQNINISSSMQELPAYRSVVRQLIPLSAQDYYWHNCFSLVGGAETYVLDCPKGMPDAIAASTVANIVNDPDLERQLTEWIGNILILPKDLSAQNEAAALAIAAIDAELGRRN